MMSCCVNVMPIPDGLNKMSSPRQSPSLTPIRRGLYKGRTGLGCHKATSPHRQRAQYLLCATALAAFMFQAWQVTPAYAQNADLNTRADTVSGLEAIPTDIPGSARRITDNPGPATGPLDLLKLAKERRERARNAPYATSSPPKPGTESGVKPADFLLSSRYRNDRQAKSGTPTSKRPMNANVLQASIMQPENGQPATASQWVRPQYPKAPTANPVNAPGKPKPAVTPPATSQAAPAQTLQIIAPWGGDNDQTGSKNAMPVAQQAVPTSIPAQTPDAKPAPSSTSSAIFALPRAAQAPTPWGSNNEPSPLPAPERDTTMTSPSAPPGGPTPAIAASHPTSDIPPKPPVSGGGFVLQLGAFRTAVSAETYWASFAIRYPELARQHHHYLGIVDLGDKGRFHRLRIGGFSSLAQVKEKCRQLAADGTACIGLPQ